MDKDISSMNIKSVLLFLYIAAGLIISAFTAFMTFYIIDVPIGIKMFSKIVATVLLTLPIIAVFSYTLGSFFSKKFVSIQNRLLQIAEENFTLHNTHEPIKEIDAIHKTLDDVSIRLERSIGELKAKNSELGWMIRSFSHDFRTPLTIIQGNLEAIEDGLVTPENLPAALKKIRLETVYMNELLGETLLFIHSLKDTPNKEPISVKKFVDEEILGLIETQNEVKLINKLDEKSTMEFTKIDLKKIIVNLLSNSAKFTTSGSITLLIQNKVLIVQDSGIGIDAYRCTKVFQPFYTVDASKNRLKSGFGLGLAIAKNLAQKNGYTLKCDPTYTDGCKMVLSPTNQTSSSTVSSLGAL